MPPVTRRREEGAVQYVYSDGRRTPLEGARLPPMAAGGDRRGVRRANRAILPVEWLILLGE
jgi:hypothetical protein